MDPTPKSPVFVRSDENDGTGRRAWRCPFELPQCMKHFNRKSDLQRHHRIHMNDRPYQCKFTTCQKSFIQRSALTVHIRTHTGEKPHHCEIPGCGKSFSDSSSLARHRRIHSGKRPYNCPHGGCKKSFCRKTTLTKHITRYHKSDRDDPCTDGDESSVESESEESETAAQSMMDLSMFQPAPRLSGPTSAPYANGDLWPLPGEPLVSFHAAAATQRFPPNSVTQLQSNGVTSMPHELVMRQEIQYPVREASVEMSAQTSMPPEYYYMYHTQNHPRLELTTTSTPDNGIIHHIQSHPRPESMTPSTPDMAGLTLQSSPASLSKPPLETVNAAPQQYFFGPEYPDQTYQTHEIQVPHDTTAHYPAYTQDIIVEDLGQVPYNLSEAPIQEIRYQSAPMPTLQQRQQQGIIPSPMAYPILSPYQMTGYPVDQGLSNWEDAWKKAEAAEEAQQGFPLPSARLGDAFSR